MQTEARVGVVVEGGQRALNSGHGGVAVDGTALKLAQQQKSLHQQSQIGTIPQLLAGGIAGALSKTCTAPLARLTILFQILHLVPGLESHKRNTSADLGVHFVAGGLAGLTAASATYPLDLVRTRLAAQTKVIYYRGIGHTLQTIVREEGIWGLYKGLGATLLGVGPSIAINFSVYETLRSSWHSQRPNDSTVLVSLTCGSLSGIASSTATFPLDLVRRRMQLEGAGGRARVYTTGLFGTFRHIIRTEGLRGLYRGILPEYYKVVPGVGICFMTYETLKNAFISYRCP
ncbi:mitochondrial substrate carrier family protein B-like isoform X2 [Vitis riparia]|uniref:mitochondrial substrate carrier family protein B-like isoform X2 n=1 Tax=Vitis riparia TaxID=96939 RepID=UPI00155A734D|nr:mitochondrial substrate carrier family protein B-like isoform X2 [Vitis riparia]